AAVGALVLVAAARHLRALAALDAGAPLGRRRRRERVLLGAGPEQQRCDDRVKVLHRCVPPTVKPSIFSVGWPTPTGTLCPSLPQTPTPVSSLRSLPSMLTRVNASGPLPISVAPLTGRPTLP